MTRRDVERWLDAVVAWDCHKNVLSEPARVMLLHMGRTLDPSTMAVTVSGAALSRAMGKDRRTIRRYIEQSTTVGFLQEREPGRQGKRTATYTATLPTLPPREFTIPSGGGPKPWDPDYGATGAHVGPCSNTTDLGTRQAIGHGATGAHVFSDPMAQRVTRTTKATTRSRNVPTDHTRTPAEPDKPGSGTPAGNPAAGTAGVLDQPIADGTRPAQPGLPPGSPVAAPFELNHEHVVTAVPELTTQPDRSRPTNFESGAA